MRINAGLFRGKSTTTGKWLYGSLLKVTIKGCPIWIIFEDDFNIIGDTVKAMSHACVDPDTVGECTGLTDKNGKLIFEGDILRLYEEETEHEADGYCVIHFGRFKDTDALSDFDHLGWHITVTTIPNEATTVFALEEQGLAFEIISNIHDNPELLKGGEGWWTSANFQRLILSG